MLGPEHQWAASFKALESARGFVWSWLRRNLDLRVTPEIMFRPDRSRSTPRISSSLLADLKTSGRVSETDLMSAEPAASPGVTVVAPGRPAPLVDLLAARALRADAGARPSGR